MTTRKFKLLKDLPGIKAGTIYINKDKGYYYPEKYPPGLGIKLPENFDFIDPSKYPNFFEEVQEPKWTDVEMVEFAFFFKEEQNYLKFWGKDLFEEWKRLKKIS